MVALGPFVGMSGHVESPAGRENPVLGSPEIGSLDLASSELWSSEVEGTDHVKMAGLETLGSKMQLTPSLGPESLEPGIPTIGNLLVPVIVVGAVGNLEERSSGPNVVIVVGTPGERSSGLKVVAAV